jgi:hypothetical protein
VDVDGDGATEIVLRTPGGVRIYKLNVEVSPNAFSEITAPGFTNSDAFAGDSRARTIRMVRSGGGFLLIGRSGIGIMTGRWVSGTVQNKGHFEKVSAGYPQFAGTAAVAYGAINTQLGLLGKEVRSFYSGTQGDLNNYRTTLVTSVKNPSLDPAIWNTVYNQINRELTLASFVAGMFGSSGFNASIINESFLSSDLTATALVQRLNLDRSKVVAEQQYEKTLTLNIAGSLLRFMTLAKSAKGITLMLSIFNTAISALRNSDNALPTAIADFDLRLAALFNDAIVANSRSQVEIAGDYSLLAEVGSLIQAGEIPTDATTHDQVLAASRFSMERMLWRSVTPSTWNVFICGQHSDNPWPNFSCDSPHAGSVTFDGGEISYLVVDLTAAGDLIEIGNPVFVQKLFNKVSNSCLTNWTLDCGFGIDPKDVYEGQTDFHYGCVTLAGNNISGFYTVHFGAPCDHVTAALRRAAPSPRSPRVVVRRRP